MAGDFRIDIGPFYGVDLYNFSTSLSNGNSPDAVNISTDMGLLSTCSGFEEAFNMNDVSEILLYYSKNLAGNKILGTRGNKILEHGSFGWKEIYDGFDGENLQYINYQQNDTDIIIMCNGKTAPVKYDGTSVSFLKGNPPVCKYIALHNERIWMAGNDQNSDRIYYSDSFAPESWNVTERSGFIDIPTWNDGKINAVCSLFDDLVVFKNRDIFRIYGTYPGEFGVSKVHGISGTIAPDSIVNTGDMVFFISSQGLCYYDGVKAKPSYDKNVTSVFTNINPDKIYRANGIFYNNCLYMSIPSIGSDINDVVVEYDVQRKTYMIKKDFNVKQFFVNDNQLMFVSEDGKVCIYGKGDSLGTKPLTAFWTTKTFDARSKETNKNVYDLYLYAKGTGDLSVTAVSDNRTYTKIIPLNERFSHKRVRLRGRGRRFHLVFANVNGSSFSVEKPQLFMDTEED